MYTLDTKVKDLELEVTQKDHYINIQKIASDEAVKKAEAREVVIEKQVEKIKKVYVNQIKYVKEYVRDANKTDCENANDLINSIVF